tara:strand:+ start:307 stop:564 length:258 start_codon:yes stop_codon:yes gene_type:complete
MIKDGFVKYTKKDFLDYAEAYGDYNISFDEIDEKRHEAWLSYIGHWSLKELQNFFGFTHKDSGDGKEIFMKTKEEFKKWKEENDR